MFVTGYPSEILRKKEGRQSYMATITLGEKNRVLLLPALRRLDGSRIAGDAAVSYLMSLVQIERLGPIALQSLRDVIKFYPLHMRWDLATKPALHMRLSRVESVPTRVLTVARIGAEGQAPCRTMYIA